MELLDAPSTAQDEGYVVELTEFEEHARLILKPYRKRLAAAAVR